MRPASQSACRACCLCPHAPSRKGGCWLAFYIFVVRFVGNVLLQYG